MKKYNVFSKFCSVFLSLAFVLAMMLNVVEAKDSIQYDNHTVGTEEFSILDGEVKQTVKTDDGTWTFTIEDVEPKNPTITPYYEQNWVIGSFNKKVSAILEDIEGIETSLLAKMSARFAGSINPYVARITKVSDGDFNATIINPIPNTEKYEILQSSATPNDYPAQARFRQKYSISTPFGVYGQHDMCLYLCVTTTGYARIYMEGIW